MNSGYRLTPFHFLEKFDFILEQLAENRKNSNLDAAIIAWCNELSLDEIFPKVSQEIITNQNLWIQQNAILKNTLKLYRQLLIITDKKLTGGIGNSFNTLDNISSKDFYHNIQEVKQKMNAKSIIIVAFVLTGVGLLLYLLNKKGSNSNLQSKNQTTNYSNYIPPIEEKYTLALLIKSDRYQDLIYSLKNNSCLQPEDSSKLYGATQGLWIETTSKFEQSQIKQELINCNPVSTTSEYDVHFVTIELDKDDYRFYPDVNPMDRRDAFIDLGKRSPQVTVSRRLSCKAYENTEFYSR